ncbi:hypothetical protein KJ359_001176 [Pestalotiopsis sp. 9143b]|nr:hypothetical protein KJ359_001176 [Pestalotiopsis sp. 9143b]
MIMSIVPQAVGSLAAFERIQQYLLQPPRRDQRLIPKEAVGGTAKARPSIRLDRVTIQNNVSSPPILKDISITVDQGAIVVCSGPVGCGKTTLAKAVLGEVPVASGTISVASKRIGYCEQSPWLPSGTLKDAICGYLPHDVAWYQKVVKICCLEYDIMALPYGEQTMIGSRGLNLSGGQRQRVVYWLVVLGNASVQYQGVLADLAHKSEGVLKIKLTEPHDEVVGEKRQEDMVVQRQNLQLAEAISDLSRATGDFSLYGYYLRSVGVRNFVILLTCTLSYSFFITFPQYWLQRWTEAPPSQTLFYVGGYLILSLLAWASTNGSMWSTYILIARQSGAELHRRLLSTIIGFSQDTQLIDRQLPPAILAISNQVFKLLSAVYSSFLESVEGIATIRAFGWEEPVENANIKALDKSQQPSYILQCLQQWLNLVLDLMVAAIATGLITLAVLIRGTTTAAQIGMALNIVLVANTTLLGLVTSWTNMEISLGAISRLKNLEAETPKEERSGENYIPVESWPSSGKVEFDNVTVAYNSDALALQDIDIEIAAGQQLNVCGRTGSGKSTLLLTLLRLLDLKSGTIRVDGIDLSLVPRSLVRQRCFVTIAQDLFVLGHASLRSNLDLWSHFTSRNIIPTARKARQILNSPVASLPHMSAGQCQMFALARAIIQLQVLNHASSSAKSQPYRGDLKPILLLDEATSSLDPETEATMRRIIQGEFTEKGHTTIAITHRASGMVKRKGENLVVLLSKGKIEKFGGVEDVLGIATPQ